MTQLLRTSFFRQPTGMEAVSRSRIPDGVLDAWFTPALADSALQRDLCAFATGSPSRRTLLAWAD